MLRGFFVCSETKRCSSSRFPILHCTILHMIDSSSVILCFSSYWRASRPCLTIASSWKSVCNVPPPHIRCIADMVHKARTPIAEGDENQKPSLSLYITLLTFDFAHPEYEMCATMMTAIKSLDDRVGGPRPNWVWEHWHPDWVFRRESEVWGK